MSTRAELLALFQNDPYGLLKNPISKKSLSTEESALVSSFEEIQTYIEEHGKEPQSNMANIIEFRLHSTLKAIRSDANKVKALKKYDFGGLLQGEGIKEITLEDIISDDPFGLLSDDLETDIFSLKHVKPVERIKPDYLSRRKVCKDFAQYKEMFTTLHEELASKKRRLVEYKTSALSANGFYVLDGILLYLKSVDGNVDSYKYNSGERDRFDGRTVCVFDNGTQSDMLFRSLDKALQLDGYCLSDLMESEDLNFQINESDVFNGYIYVLKSQNPNVQHIQNLYKIGHTTGLVAERIKNAKHEATYLFSGVDVVSTFRCLNIQSYNIEQTIHNFFTSVKLDIELFDNKGFLYNPKEWFRINYNVIEDAINLLIQNKISEFTYDDKVQQIVKR